MGLFLVPQIFRYHCWEFTRCLAFLRINSSIMDALKGLFVFGEKLPDLLLFFDNAHLLKTLHLFDLIDGGHGFRVVTTTSSHGHHLIVAVLHLLHLGRTGRPLLRGLVNKQAAVSSSGENTGRRRFTLLTNYGFVKIMVSNRLEVENWATEMVAGFLHSEHLVDFEWQF